MNTKRTFFATFAPVALTLAITALEAAAPSSIMQVAQAQSAASDCTVRGPYVDLHGCDLHDQDLTLKNLYGANLAGANLQGANLSNSDLRYANLEGANLTPSARGIARLNNTHLASANLRGAQLSRAEMAGTILYKASNSDAHGADLTGARLDGARLQSARMEYAILVGADLRNTILTANVNGTYTALQYADLRGANLAGSSLQGVVFADANLTNANLSSTDLTYASFSRANVQGANLSGASLSQAHFYMANFTDANFQGANFVEAAQYNYTICPDGTTSSAANNANRRESCNGHLSPQHFLTAVANVSTQQPVVGQTISFDGSASTSPGRTTPDILTYQWQFGDGALLSGVNATYAYGVAGTYVATLTVTNAAGYRATSQVTLSVAPPAVSGLRYTTKGYAWFQGGYFNIAWSPVSSADGYEVTVQCIQGAIGWGTRNYTRPGTFSTSLYIGPDLGIMLGSVYRVWVRPYKGTQRGAWRELTFTL